MTDRSDPDAPPHLDEHPGDGAVRGTTRMEVFADAVFAIAITLPVVELEMPEAGPGFAARLAELWPSYLGYALSALVIGIYWVHHHFSGAIYRTSGHYFLLATLLFLTMVGFVAFPTRVFTEHILDPQARETAALLYVATLAALSASWLVKWRTGLATSDVDERLEPSYVARLSRKYFITTALFAAAAALAFVRWEAGLALAALITLSYLRAPETPVYLREAPVVDEEN